MSSISYQPTPGLSYDPNDPVYWDAEALHGEIERVFEVCHGCRMCFKYCDAFPSLFSLLDRTYDGDVRKLTDGDTARVMDACFQCKLCEVQCPYTPRDKHEFQLDFPRLVHRYRAVRAKKKGVRLRDRILGNPDRLAQTARASLGLANVANRTKMHRVLMEKTLGIHRDKLLPDFAGESFEAWARKAGRTERGPGGEAVLFQTCYVQNNAPELGRDTLSVLEQSKVDVRCAEGLRCCGMPAWEHGDLASLRGLARQNLDVLSPYVDAGAKVVVINPTCSMMLRRDYPTLVAEPDRARAAKLALAVADAGEFMGSLSRASRFDLGFKSTPGKVAYHAPCHLRAQAVGFKGRDLIRKIPGVEIDSVSECCGHDGTFAMTVEGFAVSRRVGQKAFSGMQDAEAPLWVTDCPLAAIQFEQHAGQRPLHPMTVLARAYRDDGFPNKVTTHETRDP